jgi:polysaccharide chain length determinant protein (PEP-CTERM system associated)
MQLHPEQLRKLILAEAFGARKVMVTMFVSIALFLTALGLVYPKMYSASTTILVDEKNIIQPLMQGAAVATDVADRARLAREVIFGRKVMSQMLHETGRVKGEVSPEDQDQLIKRMTKQTTIASIGKNLIKIEYKDTDANRAYITTKLYADLFIEEALGTKAAESQAAFEFIDKQAKEYHEKLLRAEQALKQFRIENIDALPGTDAGLGSRLGSLQSRIEQATTELKETEIKRKSLERQLSGEAEVVSVVSREGQYRTRIAELQSQLDTLRLSYHDSYPDVVRLRHQIADLNEAIVAEQHARAERRANAKAGGSVVVDEGVINSPMYQQLKRELSQTQVQIDTLNARISEARRQMHMDLERGKRVHGGEATLAELTRDYQVNRDIYQDLLKRRENARVSMNLDKEKQGLSFRIQEPASMPLDPSGLRFGHFIVGGLALGIVIPFGLLFARFQLDKRMRIGAWVAERHKLPLLTVVPHFWTPVETQTVNEEAKRLILIVSAALLVMTLMVLLRIVRVI